MSGASGSSFILPPENNKKTSCENINITVVLSDYNSTLKVEISKGDILDIQLKDHELCVMIDDNRILGVIRNEMSNRIKECMSLGSSYEAKIIEITDELCKVQVSHI
jgi:hypothetical protein